MAMVPNKGMANVVEGDKALIWAVPDEWSFTEAATVPVAYGTVYYSLVSETNYRYITYLCMQPSVNLQISHQRL